MCRSCSGFRRYGLFCVRIRIDVNKTFVINWKYLIVFVTEAFVCAYGLFVGDSMYKQRS